MRKLHLCFNTMRFRVIAFATAAAALMAGCTDGYDDSKLVDRLDGYEKRISDLENASKQLDAQIKAGALISGVNAIEGGWRIDFTGGTTPSIEIVS